MKSLYTFLASSLFFFSANLHATELNTNYVTFNLSGSGVGLTHNETSSATGYTALNNKSDILTFTLQAGLGKEFLADKFVSFTFGGEYGILLGKQSKDLLATNMQYSDKASGTNYGFIGTINTNFYYGKMRFHPFGGLHILKSKTDYKLTYNPFNGSTPQTNIDYSEDGTQSFLVGGVRFFDARTQLLSVISVEYQVSSSFTKNITNSKIDGVAFQLNQVADVKHVPVRITLGFGLMF